jgi:hypothetical protein
MEAPMHQIVWESELTVRERRLAAFESEEIDG